jgi:polyvinyl alcohol dehydrogenase (cytochrome)
VVATAALIGSALMLTGADWPTYLGDAQRNAASSETVLSVSNASYLRKLWTYTTGGTVAASATVVSSVAYVGSWDGYEYALDTTNGSRKWRTFLGTTTGNSNCQPPSPGVSSAATVVNGIVYVGGGDAYWYALDASTGSVLWKVYTGDNSATGGHYNWASPLIYNGYAYIGVASLGDCPLVQGQLLQVDLASHQVVHTFDVVPSGHVGGGIWTSPTLDQATNTIYVTTGTRANSSDLYAEAVLAIDADTDTLKDSWPLPASQETGDSDWGTTPTLATANGAGVVAATNKNGYVYMFPRADLHDGPTWRTQVADPGPCPQCGSGTASSMAFANGLLFAAGGSTTIAGTMYPGSVRALNPATGAIVWAHAAPSAVIPALAYDNGLVVDAAGSTLEVLDAASGSRLFAFAAPGGTTFYGAPSISNGEILAGSTDSNVYAVGISTGSGEALDGWGGVHPYGGAVQVNGSAYWPGWDIARGLAQRSNRVSGYTLDGWGGVHPYGAAPSVSPAPPYWQGWDIARGIVLNPCDPNGTSGYVLDGWGGVHPFGSAPALSGDGYWHGWDIARGIALNTCTNNVVSGYIVDGWGGLHALWQTGQPSFKAPAGSMYWSGQDVVRGMVVTAVGSGYVLDDSGGVHPFGNAAPATSTGVLPGQDVSRGITFSSALGGGYVLDAYGVLHGWWITAGTAVGSPATSSHWTWKIARAAV